MTLFSSFLFIFNANPATASHTKRSQSLLVVTVHAEQLFLHILVHDLPHSWRKFLRAQNSVDD